MTNQAVIDKTDVGIRAVENTAAVARHSVVWNVVYSLFLDVTQFVQAVILARLIVPEAYGQFALVTSCIGFLSVFTSKNFVCHSLQVKDDSETHFQDHFTASAVMQVGMFVITNLLALGVRYIPGYQSIALLIHVMSLTFLFEWPIEIRQRMLERALDWKRRRLLHMIGVVVSVLLAIAMAFLGCGVYALLVPGLFVTTPFIFDLFWYAKWRPTWQWSWKNYQKAFYFGLTRVGAGVSVSGRQFLEHSVFTATLGFTALGLVNRAVGLSQLACGKMANQLMHALYPILTRLEEKTGQAALAGDLVMRLVWWSAFPLACCFGFLGLPVIATIYGPQWLEAVPYLKWTLAWISIMSLMQVAYALVLARQKAKLCMGADFLVLVGTVICLLTLLPSGVTSYYAGLTVVYGITFVCLVVVLVRISAVTLAGLGRAFVPPSICCAIALLVATAILPTGVFDVPKFQPAFLWGTSFLIAYVVSMRLLFAAPMSELISYFPARHIFSRVLYLPSR